ncbi:phenylacetic acid degradation protein [Vulcanisaeta moutnovskia 768-28]|uniref:Phenylacetic acid degradation protein n=1 Tax=Vulcanisaeta moutnovskia (strain 768-28) TaxID=985053 RepID=F0QT01_VULM7|nr:metal-sulfur cluster assembly factor [Vulcanisaeta moutnovskia]ADY00422.1 phenylacetic acid degradation protein [Vulcanisaeta moutnovskia 768-28]
MAVSNEEITNSTNNENDEEPIFKTNLPSDKTKELIEILRNVYDPEIPIDVYDLGLIYEVMLDNDKVVHVKMTLTAVGCPLSENLGYQVGAAIQQAIPDAKDIEIDVVFDPPWTPLKMTRLGREMFKAIYGYDIVEQWLKSQNEQSTQTNNQENSENA